MYELVLLETTRIEHLERLERAAQERLALQAERSNGRQLTNQGLLLRRHWLTSAGNWLRAHTVQPGLSQQ